MRHFQVYRFFDGFFPEGPQLDVQGEFFAGVDDRERFLPVSAGGAASEFRPVAARAQYVGQVEGSGLCKR